MLNRLAVLVVALAACRHSAAHRNRTLAVLDRPDATPVWSAVDGTELLVGLSHGELHGTTDDGAYALVAIDLATGQQRQVAGSLPPGCLALFAGRLYLASFMGQLGSVDLDSGAYTKLADLDTNATALAATAQGFVVGMTRRVEWVHPGSQDQELPVAFGGAEAGDVDELVASGAIVFGARQLGAEILRIDADRVTVVADHQPVPSALAATASQLVWTTGAVTATTRSLGEHLVAMSLPNGTPSVLASVHAPDVIGAVATSGTEIAYAVTHGPGRGIYVVRTGHAPQRLATAETTQLSVAGRAVYWIEEQGNGYVVKTTSF